MEAKNHQSLLFITHEYPNDTGDTAFIRNEIFHVARKFDHVRVLCLRPKSDVIVPFPSANISAVFYSKKYSKQKK